MKTRIRFSTETIAPVGTPNFIYVASLLTHRDVHYTALISQDSEEHEHVKEVQRHWPNAVILAVEKNVGTFQKIDLQLSKEVYGTYDRAQEPEESWWDRLKYFLVPDNGSRPIKGRDATVPGFPDSVPSEQGKS